MHFETLPLFLRNGCHNGDNFQVPQYNHSKNCGLFVLFLLLYFFCPTFLFSMNLVSGSAKSSGARMQSWHGHCIGLQHPCPALCVRPEQREATAYLMQITLSKLPGPLPFSVEKAVQSLVPQPCDAPGTCSGGSPCVCQPLGLRSRQSRSLALAAGNRHR